MEPAEECLGQMCWLQIPISDITRAQKFYTEIFSWVVNPDPFPDPSPTIKNIHFFNRGKTLNGAFSVMEEGFRVPNHNEKVKDALPVLPSFNVKDCDVTLKKVEELGGKVQCPKTEIGGDMGFYARFIDTEGNMIGIWSKV